MAIYRNVHVSFWNDTKIIDEMTSEEPLSSTKEEVMQLENSQNP